MSAPDSETTEHIVELDDLLVRPGTYFNPQTEVVVIVDDSASLDHEVFNMEAYEGADWVHISDEVPVDANRLEMTLEEFQTHYHAVARGSVPATAIDESDAFDDVDKDDVHEDDDGPETDRED